MLTKAELEFYETVKMEIIGIRAALERIAVNTSEKEGDWIEHTRAECREGSFISMYECPFCHDWVDKNYPYCPNCGEKIKGVKK